jgi:hypothetical protein
MCFSTAPTLLAVPLKIDRDNIETLLGGSEEVGVEMKLHISMPLP